MQPPGIPPLLAPGAWLTLLTCPCNHTHECCMLSSVSSFSWSSPARRPSDSNSSSKLLSKVTGEGNSLSHLERHNSEQDGKAGHLLAESLHSQQVPKAGERYLHWGTNPWYSVSGWRRSMALPMAWCMDTISSCTRLVMSAYSCRVSFLVR